MFRETNTRTSVWPLYGRKTNHTVWQQVEKPRDGSPGIRDTDHVPLSKNRLQLMVRLDLHLSPSPNAREQHTIWTVQRR